MATDTEVILIALQKERDELHERIMQVDRIINRVKSIDYSEAIEPIQGDNAPAQTRKEIDVNRIESFWAQLKRCISGTHIHCDKKYLQLYADECAFRVMNKDNQSEMFDTILRNVL